MLQLLTAGYLVVTVVAQNPTLEPPGPIPTLETNCTTACWRRGGECYWEPPGLGLTAVSSCQSGVYPRDPEICYCGRCYLCDQDTTCRGECALRPPSDDYIATGTCSPNSCLCWEKLVADPCEDPVCSRKLDGVCSAEQPGPTFEETGYYCNQNTTCPCWQDRPCDEDPVCSQLFPGGGQCNKTSPGDGWVASGYMCDQEKGCHCWIREMEPCHDPNCQLLFNGICDREQPGPTYEQTSYRCNRTDDCYCWAERNETSCERIEETCFEIYDGICGMEKPFDDYVDSGYMCNQTTGCICWKRDVPCEKDVDPVCRERYQGECHQTAPGHLLPTGYYCNEETDCGCYRECPNDPVCSEEFYQGVCNTTWPGPGYQTAHTGYMCRTRDSPILSDSEACYCWEKESGGDCSRPDNTCNKQMKGICDQRKPKKDYVPTDYFCRRGDNCNCWVKCKDKSKKCKNTYGGRCSVKQPTGFVRSRAWCDKCWIPCEPGSSSEKCGDGTGFCFPPDYEVPAGLRRDGWCDKLGTCECWVPVDEPEPCDPPTCLNGRGSCYPPGSPIPDNLVCDGWCNDDQSCQCCYDPNDVPCEEKTCAEGRGRCYPPESRTPDGWSFDGWCDRGQTCECWVPVNEPEPCDPATCLDGEGRCYPRDSIIPANMVCEGWCDEDESCQCCSVLDVPCDEKTCANGRGRCLPPTEAAAQPVPEGWVRDGWCDSTQTCECWKEEEVECNLNSPKCKGGKCYPVGMSPGKNWKKEGWCNRDKTCQCWKKVKCQASRKCQNKGGKCAYFDSFEAVSVINGKNLCKKPCSCVRLEENQDSNV